MLNLPNGCSSSELAVFPKNWKSQSASVRKFWYIHYRFYDPRQQVKSKQVFIKRMNKFSDPSLRRQATQALIDDELDLLKNEGYNPIIGAKQPPIDESCPIEIHTPIIQALELANKELDISEKTRKLIRSYLVHIQKATDKLKLSAIAIGSIKRKHMLLILKRCERMNNWTGNTFNSYRAHLMMLFKKLVEFEAIDQNPVRDISKRKTVRRIRATIPADKRKMIDEYLKSNHYTFWRFMHIFFHSGARESELLRLKVKDVDIVAQRYKMEVKKGSEAHEANRTIKDIARQLWEEVLAEGQPDDFVFSRGLKPGPASIRPDQITRRWRKHIKQNKDLNVMEDFYSLKHLNTTQTVDILSEQDAAAMNAHKSTAMVVKIYDTNQAERQHEKLKRVTNSFS